MKKTGSLCFLATLLSSILILVLYYKDIPFLEELEGSTLNFMFDVRGPSIPDPNIAIVSIDEKSLRELGRWPWSRKYWAMFLNQIEKSAPQLLIFDVWFSERESGNIDKALQAALKRSGKVILPVVFEMNDPSSSAEISQGAIPENLINGPTSLLEGKGIIASLPEFNNNVRRVGHINVDPDYDGTIRWTPLLIRHKDHVFPSLALAASMELLSPDKIEISGDRISLDNLTVLTDESSRMLINYNGPANTYPFYSFIDVLKGSVGPEALKDKILFIGSTAQGIYDMRLTPFSSNTPGVEVNANIIDNILHKSFLVRRPLDRLLDMVFILLAGIIFGLIIPRVRAALAFPFALTVIFGYSALAFYFFKNGHWISAVYPGLSLVFSYLSATAVRLFIGERKIIEIRRMFSSYVSKQVVDELIKYPEKAKLGGQVKEITIIFSDLKGFTSFSEKNTPQQVVSTLNDYFAVMSECIIEYNGTLDKFLGDGIMAFWNAPLDQEKHPELALRCALEMSRRFERLQKKWMSESRELLDYGIGINIGDVIVGNVGVSGKKMEYTAIGDTVNVTHRVQDQTRIFKRNIIITEKLFKRVQDIVDAEELGSVTLKGKEEPVTLLAVTGLKDHETKSDYFH